MALRKHCDECNDWFLEGDEGCMCEPVDFSHPIDFSRITGTGPIDVTLMPGSKPAPLRATDICAKAAELVGGERDRTHGSKRENFRKIAALWDAYLSIRRDRPIDELDVGHMMVLLKVARTQHGAFNLDDYIDMAGYAGCTGEIAAEDAA